MRIACVGGGPAGLYLRHLHEAARPAARHRRVRAQRPWRHVRLGRRVLRPDHGQSPRQRSRQAPHAIEAGLAHWDDIDVHIHGQTITSSGHGFSGIGRKRLLNMLQDRARELGVRARVQAPRSRPTRPSSRAYDLVIASDGANSARARSSGPMISASISTCGRTNMSGSAPTRRSRLSPSRSSKPRTAGSGRTPTSSMTAPRPSSSNAAKRPGEGLASTRWAKTKPAARRKRCSPTISTARRSPPTPSICAARPGSIFRASLCKNWLKGNVILMGDAAHTAHFSIGSGTKLAFEDAIMLAEVLHWRQAARGSTGASTSGERQIEVLKLQNAARNSTEWFEHIDRYVQLEPLQFAYSLLTRSQRVSHENLRLRDKDFLTGVERWFAARAGAVEEAPPPMFAPLKLREHGDRQPRRCLADVHVFRARRDGERLPPRPLRRPRDGRRRAHLHRNDRRLRRRAHHAGLRGDVQLEHVAAWKRIVDYVHTHSHAKFALQLATRWPQGLDARAVGGGSSRSTSCRTRTGSCIGPSPIAWSRTQRHAARDDPRRHGSRESRFRARDALMGEQAGFDMLELHCGHGYLLSSFLTPLMQQAHRRIRRRIENWTLALSARSVRGDARGVAASTNRCQSASPPPIGSMTA